jgi:transcriptional regulator with XRE-family HTH domain
MSNDLNEIATAVKNERFRRRLSVESACAVARMSHVTWRRIEKGERVQERSLFAALRSLDLDAEAGQSRAVTQSSVLGGLIQSSVAAGRMRALTGFGGDAA